MVKKSTIILLAIFMTACSQFKHGITSTTWHNINAKYNALIDARYLYELANDRLDSIIVDDYSTILPIIPKVDSNLAKPVFPELKEVIRLTSLIAERHSNSKHLEEAYMLLGSSRILKEELLSAIEVFKYINSTSDNAFDKQRALILLMRAYMETRDFNAAEDVRKQITATTLFKKNKELFFETSAAYYQRLGEPAVAVVFLDEALKEMPKSAHKARGLYIAGQLYQSLGKRSEARERWLKVRKAKPSYDLEFNTGIALLLLSNDLGANTVASFNKMLDDRKNVDLKDKIYYNMGAAQAEQRDYKAAIENYKKSASFATNQTQKGIAYREIAEIYLDELKDYEKSKVYYDSTLAALNPRSEEFDAIAKKSEALRDFVKYKRILAKEDSLQKLALLNPLELEEMVDRQLEREAAELQKIEVETKKLSEAARQKNVNQNNSAKDLWLFYDQLALTRSRAEFIREWGTRPLEDNWRRKNKEIGSISLQVVKETALTTEEEEAKKNEEALAMQEMKKAELKKKKEALLAEIPNTPGKLKQSNLRRENALYQIGKIYRLQFNEPENAKKVFNELLTNYPKSEYEQEVLYFMAIMAGADEQNQYREELIMKYPMSNFARQIKKGNAGVVDAGMQSEAEKVYENLYAQYKAGEVTNTLAQTEQALQTYTGTAVEDKLAMLRIMLLAKTSQVDVYRIALMDFIQSYPKSNLGERVSGMLKALKN